MNHGPAGGGRWAPALVAATLALTGWLADPSASQPLGAVPVVQAQVSPTPRPSPTPTKTTEQKLQDLERSKLEKEAELLNEQQNQLQQQQDIAKQVWRAPVEALSQLGPTLVGLGLLLLAWRALDRLLPPPPRPRPAAVTDEDDEDDDDL